MKSDFIKNTKEYFPNDLIENDFLLSFNCEGSTVLDVRDNKEIVSRTKNLPSEKGTLDAVVIHELLLVGGESAKGLAADTVSQRTRHTLFRYAKFSPAISLEMETCTHGAQRRICRKAGNIYRVAKFSRPAFSYSGRRQEGACIYHNRDDRVSRHVRRVRPCDR